METYEYRTVDGKVQIKKGSTKDHLDQMDAALTALGAEGWRVVKLSSGFDATNRFWYRALLERKST